jgi:adenine-specific DNA-methyltransferase
MFGRSAKVTSGAGRASKERTAHPAQFPLDLCERVIKGFSPPRGIVVDPFPWVRFNDWRPQWGRYSVGFEIKKDYCAVASERIRGALEQEGLPF